MFENYDEEYEYYTPPALARENYQQEQEEDFEPESSYSDPYWDAVTGFSSLGATTTATIVLSHLARLSPDWQAPFGLIAGTAILAAAGMTVLARTHHGQMTGAKFLLAIAVGLVGGWLDAFLLAWAGPKGHLIKIGLVGLVVLTVSVVWTWFERRGSDV